MAYVRFDEWVPEVVAQCPDVPRPLAVNAIRDSAIEFCTLSEIWRHELDAFPVTVGVRDYELDIPAGAYLVAVKVLRFEGSPLEPKSIDDLDLQDIRWRTRDGMPSAFVHRDIDQIALNRAPTQEGSITGTVALRPSVSAIGMDSSILREGWKEAIASGARARLRRMPDKAWSNPQLSVADQGLFIADAERAKSLADKGYSGKVRRRVRAHWF